jgi:hypothetical protein
MACVTVGESLTLGGLVVEFSVLAFILWTVGLDRWVKARVRWLRALLPRAWSSAKRAARRLLPSRRRAREGAVRVTAGAGGGVAGGVGPKELVEWPENRPPPGSLAEVGERLNQLAGGLNRHERMIPEQVRGAESRVREEVGAVQRQAEGIQEEAMQRARNALAERRREAAIFTGGVALQYSHPAHTPLIHAVSGLGDSESDCDS